MAGTCTSQEHEPLPRYTCAACMPHAHAPCRPVNCMKHVAACKACCTCACRASVGHATGSTLWLVDASSMHAAGSAAVDTELLTQHERANQAGTSWYAVFAKLGTLPQHRSRWLCGVAGVLVAASRLPQRGRLSAGPALGTLVCLLAKVRRPWCAPDCQAAASVRRTAHWCRAAVPPGCGSCTILS